MNSVSVYSKYEKYKPLEKRILFIAKKVLKCLKRSEFGVEFFLISDTEIKKINKTHRGKNVVTNVLSFCEPKRFVRGNQKENFLGEIYLAPDYVQKHKQSLEHMIVHGILHLCGYDHRTKKDAEKMEKKEILLLKKNFSKQVI